jgi:hypothetical protein
MTYTNSGTHGTGSRSYTRDRGVTVARTAAAEARGYVTPEDYGAIGDGEIHFAADALGVGGLLELQAWGGGIYSFATSIHDTMDYLGWQAALYAGGLVKAAANAEYVIDQTLIVRNGTVQIDGQMSTITFRHMAEIPDDGSNLLANPSFDAGGSNWQNTALSPRVDVVFSGGKAVFTDPPVTFTPGESHFGQFGQQLVLPKGRWTVEAYVKLTEGASGGFFGARTVGIGFFKDGPGQGGWAWPDPLFNISSAGASAFGPFEGVITFDVEAPENVTVWCTLSGFNCDWEVHWVRIRPFLMNFGVWCTGDYAGFGERYDETEISNLTVIGPALEQYGADSRYGTYNHYAGPRVSGFLHKSFGGEGARANLRNVDINSWYRGVVFSDQAFLIRHEHCKISYCAECIYFTPAVRNAGENMRFTNCIIFNSGLAVNAQSGVEWNFVGCSMDFCRRMIVGRRGTLINFNNHHFEFNAIERRLYLTAPATGFAVGGIVTGGTSGATARILIADRQDDAEQHLVVEALTGTFQASETITGSTGGSATVLEPLGPVEYLIDLTGGSQMVMATGQWLQSGSTHRGMPHAARLESVSDVIAFGDVWGFNWQTASGDWATGAGRITFNNHVGPGNALLPTMMIRNQHMDAFAGNGGIAGTGTWEDQGFTGPADGIGLDFSAHSDEALAPTSRGTVPSEIDCTADATVFRTTGTASLKLAITAAYTGGAETRVFLPVSPGKIVLPEFYYSKPTVKAPRSHGPYTSGLPAAGDTIYVNTTAGQTTATIEDKHVQWIGGSGPRAGWTVTLSSVTGNPGGVANAVWNATHTVVARLDAFRFTIALPSAASTTASNAGGTGVVASYSQTSVLIFMRNFWVRQSYFDAHGRPVLAQTQFQGERNVEVTLTAQGWTRWTYATWYAEAAVPVLPTDRVARGRAPEWATHWMMVFNWQNIREADLAAPPALHLTDFYANVL